MARSRAIAGRAKTTSTTSTTAGKKPPKRKGVGFVPLGGKNDPNDNVPEWGETTDFHVFWPGADAKRDEPKFVGWDLWLDIFKRNSFVSSCVRTIAECLLAGGWRVVPVKEGSKPSPVGRDLIEGFFNDCHPYYAIDEILRAEFEHLSLAGRDYIEVAPNELGQPAALYDLPQGTIVPAPQEDGLFDLKRAFVQTVKGRDKPIDLPWERVLWLRLPGMRANSVNPISPVELLLMPSNSIIECDRFVNSYYKSGGKAGFVVVNKNWDKTQATEWLRWFKRNYTDSGNGHQPLVLYDETEVGPPPKGMNELGQLVDVQKLDGRKVAGVFDVDPRLVGYPGEGGLGGAEREQIMQSLFTKNINPKKAVVSVLITRQIVVQGFGVTDWKFELTPFKTTLDAASRKTIADTYAALMDKSLMNPARLTDINRARQQIDDGLDVLSEADLEDWPGLEPVPEPPPAGPPVPPAGPETLGDVETEDEEDEPEEDGKESSKKPPIEKRWDEESHPRADDGKFAEGGGSSGGGTMSADRQKEVGAEFDAGRTRVRAEKAALADRQAKDRQEMDDRHERERNDELDPTISKAGDEFSERQEREESEQTARHERETDEQEAAHEAESEAMSARHSHEEDAQVERHEAEEEALGKKHSEASANLEARQEAEVKAYEAHDPTTRHEHEVKALLARHEHELSAAQDADDEDEEGRVSSRHEDESIAMTDRHEHEVDEYNEQHDAMTDRHSQEADDLEEAHDAERSDLKARHEKEDEELPARHERESDQLARKHHGEVLAREDRQDKEATALAKKHDDESKAWDKTHAHFVKKVAEIGARHDKERKALADQHAAETKEKHAALEGGLMELAKKLYSSRSADGLAARRWLDARARAESRAARANPHHAASGTFASPADAAMHVSGGVVVPLVHRPTVHGPVAPFGADPWHGAGPAGHENHVHAEAMIVSGAWASGSSLRKTIRRLLKTGDHAAHPEATARLKRLYAAVYDGDHPGDVSAKITGVYGPIEARDWAMQPRDESGRWTSFGAAKGAWSSKKTTYVKETVGGLEKHVSSRLHGDDDGGASMSEEDSEEAQKALATDNQPEPPPEPPPAPAVANPETIETQVTAPESEHDAHGNAELHAKPAEKPIKKFKTFKAHHAAIADEMKANLAAGMDPQEAEAKALAAVKAAGGANITQWYGKNIVAKALKEHAASTTKAEEKEDTGGKSLIDALTGSAPSEPVEITASKGDKVVAKMHELIGAGLDKEAVYKASINSLNMDKSLSSAEHGAAMLKLMSSYNALSGTPASTESKPAASEPKQAAPSAPTPTVDEAKYKPTAVYSKDKKEKEKQVGADHDKVLIEMKEKMKAGVDPKVAYSEAMAKSQAITKKSGVGTGAFAQAKLKSAYQASDAYKPSSSGSSASSTWIPDDEKTQGDEHDSNGRVYKEYITYSDHNAADQAFMAATNKEWNSLPELEKKALRSYTGSAYGAINRAIVHSKGDVNAVPEAKVKAHIKRMDSAIAKMPGLPKDTVLYRGTSMGVLANMMGATGKISHEDAKGLVGKVIKHGPFASTSIYRDKALGFSTGVLFRITAKAGTGGAWMGSRSKIPSEREFIMKRDTTMKVHKVSRENGKTVVHVRVG